MTYYSFNQRRRRFLTDFWKGLLKEIDKRRMMNFGENIILENEWVRLAPLTDAHLEELLFIAIKNPNLLQYSPSQIGTKELLEDYIKNAVNARKDEQRYPFAIFDKKRNRYIGSTSYGSFSAKDLRLEIGWTWIDRESQGTGLNRHCKDLLIKYAFEELKYQRIEFRTDSRNIQSRKAIEKIGGKFEGKLRSHTLMPDGYRRDTVCYSILKNEWSI